MAEQHDMFDDIIEISKGVDALKNPFGGITDALLGTVDENKLPATSGSLRSPPEFSSWCSAPCCCSRPLPTWAIMSCCSVWSSWFIRSTLLATRNSRRPDAPSSPVGSSHMAAVASVQ